MFAVSKSRFIIATVRCLISSELADLSNDFSGGSIAGRVVLLRREHDLAITVGV